MTTDKLFIGIDTGSVSVNTVILQNGNVIFEDYTRIKEQPAETVLKILKKILEKFPAGKIASVGTTGTGGKLMAKLLNGTFINEIVAQSKSAGYLHPEIKTIIDIGGEDAKMILLRYDNSTDNMVVEGFSMNTICAAGTGSFLDQQASRLGVSIEKEFGELALKSEKPPRIAGRCSVFAKTDMIHLQQQGTPDYDIVAGLCFALARTFKSNICKGKEMKPPIAFHGGVAANKGMVRAFREILELSDREFIIPQHHASMGAIGAAILSGEGKNEFAGIKELEEYLKNPQAQRKGLPPLSDKGINGKKPEEPEAKTEKNNSSPGIKREGFLGIDVGSISTNVVVIDREGKLLSWRYLPTAGRPIEAVRQGIREVGAEVSGWVDIKGVGTTGSGRYLIGDFVGADIVKNEITAQATAAIWIDPSVDTIFEIGGQDSKYISIEKGAIVDFEMNKVCAAGTGSFLEEQAERLGIDIKDEFARLSFSSKNPVHLGERCTVFMESDLIHHQQSMAKTEDLSAGLCYSIAQNYLNRVVGRKRIGRNIFFQGGVALNKSVIAAFEKILGKKITVPPNSEVTGAIGAALVAKTESQNWTISSFKGWDKIINAKYELRSFECRDCPNHCEIREVKTEGSKTLYYGSRCEKYNMDSSARRKKSGLPDLFAERENCLLNLYEKKNGGKGKKKVGIPRALIFYDLYPFWEAFFDTLGFEVILSDKTNKNTIRLGLDAIVEETCFPVKVAHGHIANLLEKKVDYIFLPMVLNMEQKNPSMEQSFNCPYVQTLPFIARSAFDFEKEGVKLLNPIIAFGWGKDYAASRLMKLGKKLGSGRKSTGKAIDAAYKAQSLYQKTLRERGRKVLATLPENR
ncbi:MAG TPA: acyl-CoA dehydratase activase, partial [bacterium]|nr:acyl-CoA dehydratase activase [bacterium]